MALSNMKIGQRMGLAFSTVLALLVLVIAISLWGGRTLRDDATNTQALEQLAGTATEYALLTQLQVVRTGILASNEASFGLIASTQTEWDRTQPVLLEQQRRLVEGVRELNRPEAMALLDRAEELSRQRFAARDDLARASLEGDLDQMDLHAQRWQGLATSSIQAIDELAKWLNAEADKTLAQAYRSANVVEWVKIGFGALALLLGVLVAALLSRGITRPLSEALDMANRIAHGDLTNDIRTRRGDEVGDLLKALNEMRLSLLKVVGEIRHASEGIGVAASEIAQGNQDLSSRTEQSASSLEETASSMEELTATVRQSADSARQANQLASSAAGVAAKGGTVVGQVVHTMNDISQSSQRISDIISVIDGIAFQTNILALNAAVEAARAGEQGRGFAVVAGEVRTLAQRSAQAAKEIKELINASVDRVQDGSKLVEEAGSTMQEIVASVQRVADIIGEISAATGEQSDGIAQVNVAINQLDQMTQQNAALVEESAAAAQSMREQTERLAQAVAVFRTGDQAVMAVSAPSRRAVPKAAPKAAVKPAGPVSSAKPVAAPLPSPKPHPEAQAKAIPAAPKAVKPAPALANKAIAKVPPPPAKPAKTSDADGEWETF